MTRKLSRRDVLRVGGAAALTAAGLAWGQEVVQMADTSSVTIGLEGAWKQGQYVLPPLPYAYDALGELCDRRTLEFHHDKHHQAYVAGLNKTLEKLQALRKTGDYEAVKALSRDLAFHGSGHILHCLFWHSMTPKPVAMPDRLAKAAVESFGSVEAMSAQFAAATKSVEASGWGVLAYEGLADRLLILQAEKHQDLTVWGVVPILVCDVWEHAYYLQYQNNRGLWVDNFMKLANWEFADRRLGASRSAGTA